MGPCGSCWESFVPHMRRGWVCGESFVPEVAWRGCCWANNVVLWRSPRAGWRAMAVPWRRPRAPRPGRLDSPALHASAVVGLCAKKFALRARNPPNLTFLRLLGEFCRGLSGGGAVPGEFCRVCRPSTVPGTVPGPTLPRPCHRPRNSSWPDTTPALPLPTGTAAWPVGTAISHAIPQQLVQTLNLHRWNCNVFWVC